MSWIRIIDLLAVLVFILMLCLFARAYGMNKSEYKVRIERLVR